MTLTRRTRSISQHLGSQIFHLVSRRLTLTIHNSRSAQVKYADYVAQLSHLVEDMCLISFHHATALSRTMNVMVGHLEREFSISKAIVSMMECVRCGGKWQQ